MSKKFKVDTEDLKKAVKKLKTLKPNTVLEYMNVLFCEIMDNILVLHTTDGENVVRTIVPIEAKKGEQVEFVINRERFYKLVSKIYSPTITGSVANKYLTLKTDKGQYRISLTESQFDPLSVFENASDNQFEPIELATLDSEEFMGAIKTAGACADSAALKPALSGMYLDTRGSEHVNLVASDGHVMAILDIAWDLPDDIPPTLIFVDSPIMRLSIKGEITVSLTPLHLYIETDDTTYFIRVNTNVLDYVDYHKVIPESDSHFIYDTQEFKRMLDRMEILSDSYAPSVKVDVNNDKAVSFYNPQDAERGEEIIEDLSGDLNPVVFELNIKSIKNLIGLLSTDKFALYYTGGKSATPIILKEYNDEVNDNKTFICTTISRNM